ncbi:adenylosuccinate synthase [Alkalibacillus haloalkaliphilus]|uniref:Adenylosuccinate synthetase n=1 Tax=Alkalibacillus haloalkaliphilus TaxID=94136 RepID=A0A511W0N1_9BACI|nr:adenylosuccinate synthase [Alkalibacillus haloalkaliphilus]GEN44647.1 adenylosuccinate synthetase [Alkalibacillus haloalkaliphilus]
MTTAIVVGTQWGDEGKGKITDFLAQQADVIARYQGGDNAGHTIKFNGDTYKLHLIPSGVFNSNKTCLLGNGMVINPQSLIKEMDYLKGFGLTLDHLKISNRAHVIMPYHIELDRLQEESKGKEKQIGTTKKGIGPAYSDKVNRSGVRFADLIDPDSLHELVHTQVEQTNEVLEKIYNASKLNAEEIYETYKQYGEMLKSYVVDTSVLLDEAVIEGRHILFEGAQGVMLDIDHGTYPYVTSSSTSAAGVATGSGIGPNKVDRVIGVSKAYTTRVGDGPFPTELHDDIGEQIREVGREYGTTTGRPRRVGWFDAVVINHARRTSGITDISLNSLDVLTGIKELKLCVGYERDGELIKGYPASQKELTKCTPVYETLSGWDEDLTNVNTFDELPKEAQQYINRIEALTGVQVAIFSVGPDREQTVVRNSIY